MNCCGDYQQQQHRVGSLKLPMTTDEHYYRPRESWGPTMSYYCNEISQNENNFGIEKKKLMNCSGLYTCSLAYRAPKIHGNLQEDVIQCCDITKTDCYLTRGTGWTMSRTMSTIKLVMSQPFLGIFSKISQGSGVLYVEQI